MILKVYSDMKGNYILLRSKAIEEAGFKGGCMFECSILPNKIILEVEK